MNFLHAVGNNNPQIPVASYWVSLGFQTHLWSNQLCRGGGGRACTTNDTGWVKCQPGVREKSDPCLRYYEDNSCQCEGCWTSKDKSRLLQRQPLLALEGYWHFQRVSHVAQLEWWKFKDLGQFAWTLQGHLKSLRWVTAHGQLSKEAGSIIMGIKCLIKMDPVLVY